MAVFSHKRSEHCYQTEQFTPAVTRLSFIPKTMIQIYSGNWKQFCCDFLQFWDRSFTGTMTVYIVYGSFLLPPQTIK